MEPLRHSPEAPEQVAEEIGTEGTNVVELPARTNAPTSALDQLMELDLSSAALDSMGERELIAVRELLSQGIGEYSQRMHDLDMAFRKILADTIHVNSAIGNRH